MTMPAAPSRWTLVRQADPRWFHNIANLSEINFHPNGSITFFTQGERMRMSCLTLTTAELAWIGKHSAWLLTRPDAEVS